MKINISFFQNGLVCLIIALFAGICTPSLARAQEKLSAEEFAETQKQYDQLVNEWRTLIKKTYWKQNEFNHVTMEESSEIRKQWQKNVDQTNAVFYKLQSVAIKLFDNHPKPPKELTDLVMRIANNYFEKGMYEKADELAARIQTLTNVKGGMMTYIRGRAAIFMNRFDEAEEFRNEYGGLVANLPEREQILFDVLKYLKTNYQKELELRKKEAATDDLPRVEIKTTKGTITVELFENEAPGTVGNFISLIEKGHYNGKVFHRVLNKFMAQGGAYTSQGRFDNPDYYIYDECGRENARGHFRGVLSMAKNNEPHTANAQFFITYVPVPTSRRKAHGLW